MDTQRPVAGENVILVEDIRDSGLTLEKILALLEVRGAASLAVCALLAKEDSEEVKIPIKYQGFKIPKKFVVGDGIDWAQYYRVLRGIYAVKFDDEQGDTE